MRKYYPALDGLRGIAVLAVIAFHLQMPYGDYGYVGVTLFFILSGFLITGILIDTKAAPNYFSSFYIRRSLRIFPLYYGTLLVVFFVIPHFWAAAKIPPAHDRIFYFLYLNNSLSLLNEANNVHFLGHFWSLAVEEQFYWFWPLCIFFVPVVRMKWLIGACAVAGLCAWIYVVRQIDSPDAGRLTMAALPSLMAGASVALGMRRQTVPGVRWVYLPLAIGLFFAFLQVADSELPSMAFLSNCLAVGSLWMLFLAALFGPTWFQRGLSISPLRLVGRYSYGMYVFHVPLLTLYGKAETLRDQFTVLGLTFLVAMTSFELFEKRINALKHRF